MNTLLTTLGGILRTNTARVMLGTAIAGMGTASTAQAHDDLHLDLDLRHGHVELEGRHWERGVVEERQTRIWVEPVYQTVAGPRVWVEPVYKTVVDRVWREPVMQDNSVQILVPETVEVRDIVHGYHVRRERIVTPAHYETRVQQVIAAPGHFEDVTRQELVSEGHWQTNDQQVLLTPGHWEMRIDRVPVEGHWVERPVVHIR